MHRREALKLIQDDMDKNFLKEVGYVTDGRTYMNVTAKAMNGEFYRYCYNALSEVIGKYKLVMDITTQEVISFVDTGREVKK